ncbi:hypothetical protein L0156_13275, partial [bacterium]|nr:hypothetical protein [bacterium]
CTKSENIITISDTGEGISSDFLPYVFDRFRQADSVYAPRSRLAIKPASQQHMSSYLWEGTLSLFVIS